MSFSVGSLEIELAANIARLQRDLDEAKRVASGAMQHITKAADLAKGALAGLATGLSVGAFAGMIKGAIDGAAALNDLAISTGASVESLSAFAEIGRLSDVSAQTISGSMNKLAKNMAGATEESKGTGKALEALGISFGQFAALSPDEQMKMVAKAMAGFEDGSGKAAVSMALFGKEGAALLPFLKDLAEAGELQAKVTTEQAAAADNFGDNLTRLEVTGKSWAKELAMGMLPALNTTSQAFLDVMNGSGGVREEVRKLSKDGSITSWTESAITALTYVSDAGEGVWRVFKTIGTTVGASAAQIAAVMRGDFAGAKQIGEAWKVDVSNTWAAETFGQRLRERIAELKAAAPAVEEAKKALKFVNVAAPAVNVAAPAVDAANKELKKQADLIAKLSGVNNDYVDNLARLQALRVEQNMTDERYVELVQQLIEEQPAVKAMREADAKALAEQKKVMDAVLTGVERDIAAIHKEAEALERKVATYGMLPDAITAAQIAELEAAKQSLVLTEQGIEDIQRRIDALGRLRDAQGAAQAQEAAAEGAKQLATEYNRAAEQIGQSLTDNLMRSGKSFFQYLKDLARTTWLRPVLAPIGSFGGATMAGLMGPTATAQAGGSSAGSMLGSAAGSMFGAGGLSGAIAGGAGWLTGATTLGGSLSAGASLIGTGTLAGAMSGAGMIVGALGPIALAAGAIYALAKAVDHSGTYHTGGAASATGAGVHAISAEALNFQPTRVSEQANAFTAQLASSVVSILDSTALAFGKTAGYTAATAFADDSSKDGAWGALVISKLGDKLIDWQDARTSRWAPKEFADGAEGQKQYLAAISASVRTALDGIGLPGWAKSMLDALDEGAGLDEMAKVVDSINATQRALKAMGEQLVGFSNLTDAAVSALIDAAGGIESLSAGANAFFQNFYSEQEKNVALTKQVEAALAAVNLTMPTTNAGWRALVEQQLALGESGAKAVAVLFGQSEAFAKLHPLVEQTTDALQAQATAQQAAAQAIRDQADALLGEVDSRFAVLQEVVGREKAALQAQIEAHAAAAEKLRSLSASLRGALAGRQQDGGLASRAEAQAEIAAALAIARAGGPLPDAAKLQGALGVLGKDAAALYATYADYQRDFYRTQNDIAELAKFSDDALSVEEATLRSLQNQVKSLDQMLAQEQAQINELKGINTNGLSIVQAIQALHGAITAAQGNPVVAATKAVTAAYQSSLGRTPDTAGMQYWQQQAAAGVPTADIVSAISNSPEAVVRGLYQSVLGRAADAAGLDFFVRSGASVDAIRAALMQSDEYKAKIPAFVNGGDHAGGVRLVGEAGAEVEFTGPSRIVSHDAFMRRLSAPAIDNREVVAELRSLREQTTLALARIASYTNRTALSNEDMNRRQLEAEEA